jgi:hypothetical protein
MKYKLTLWIVLGIGFTGLVSCSDPTAPEDVIQEETYINVFTELVIINQLGDAQLDSLARDSLKREVFAEYGVNREQFDEAHSYYQKQPDAQLRRLDKIEEILTEQRERFQDKLNEDRKRIADSLMVQDSLSASDSLSQTDTTSVPELIQSSN